MTTDVLTLIDWTRRPGDTDGPPGPVVFDVVSPHGGNWAIVPRVPGEILTAAKYNADRQAAVDNDTPLSIDDYSATLAEMQAEVNPYPGGAVSQPTSLAGELERIRWVLHQLNPAAPAWYAVPSVGISVTGTVSVGALLSSGLVSASYFLASNTQGLQARKADTVPQWLIQNDASDNVLIASDLPAGKSVIVPGTLSVGHIYISGAATVEGDAVVHGTVAAEHIYVNGAATVEGDAVVHGTVSVEHIHIGGAATVVGLLTVEGAATVQGALWAESLNITGSATVQVQLNVSQSLVLQKGFGIWWGDRVGVLMNTSNELRLHQTCVVEQTLYVTSTLGTGADAVIGPSGAGNVLARNAPKAWARATTTGALVASANIGSVTVLGPGVVRFTLLPGQIGWVAAMATADVGIPPCFCEVAVQNFQTVDVRMVAHDGTVGSGALTCVMF